MFSRFDWRYGPGIVNLLLFLRASPCTVSSLTIVYNLIDMDGGFVLSSDCALICSIYLPKYILVCELGTDAPSVFDHPILYSDASKTDTKVQSKTSRFEADSLWNAGMKKRAFL